jgi:cupin fold WbuC family metalloprotein
MVICIRGHFVEENFYDEHGILTDAVDMVLGGLMVNVPAGQWHNLESLESGTVLFEAKDGPYRPLEPEEIMSL